MSKLKLISAAILATWATNAYSQAEWEPQKNITGYVSLEGEYFSNLKNYSRNYGISLAEAGLLASYQPAKNLTFKTVFVYRPSLSFDQMLNELSAEYKLGYGVNIKAGRFLTPLSSTNTFYYAPVNMSATLPMTTSFHETFPINMDAVSVNGTVGETWKLGYNLFGGGYWNSLYLKSGSLQFFGTENQYFQQLDGADFSTINTSSFNSTLSFGGGSHVELSYKDYVNFGLSMFTTAKENVSINLEEGGPATVQSDSSFSTKKLVFGSNLGVKISTVQVLCEYWTNKMTMGNKNYKNNGGFITVSNSFNKITPYVRLEYLKTPFTQFGSNSNESLEYNRYTIGVNYKPVFETTFKLEYMNYQYKSHALGGIIASVIYSF